MEASEAALGTGGLLLPWQGGGALALPDLTKAADIPVTAAPLPISAATIELRRIVDREAEIHRTRFGYHESGFRGWPTIEEQHRYCEAAEVVLNRPVQSWADVAEIAEIAWKLQPKVGLGADRPRYVTLESYQPHLAAWHGNIGMPCRDTHARAIACLIEAVMTLGGGRRLDPLRYDSEVVDTAVAQGRVGEAQGGGPVMHTEPVTMPPLALELREIRRRQLKANGAKDGDREYQVLGKEGDTIAKRIWRSRVSPGAMSHRVRRSWSSIIVTGVSAPTTTAPHAS